MQDNNRSNTNKPNTYRLKDNQMNIIEFMQEKASLSGTVAKFTKNRIKEMQHPPIKTGFHNLNNLLGGGITPGLIVLGAVSSLGKSTFALQMAENMSAKGVTVLFFSMEMTKERIASKAMSRQIFLNLKEKEKNPNIPLTSIDAIQSDDFFYKEKTDSFTQETWQAVHKAKEEVEQRTKNLHIIEGSETMQSGENISCYVKNFFKDCKGKEKKPLVVMIDYLQILTSTNDRAMPKAIVDENIRKFKGLANELKIPVIVISSVNRENYNKPITFEAFKESGNIEYTADEVLGLQFCAAREANGKGFDINTEKAAFPRRVEIVALKQRYRQCYGTATFKYYAKFDCFEEDNTKDEYDTKYEYNAKDEHPINGQNNRITTGHYSKQAITENKKTEVKVVGKKPTEMSITEFEAWLKEGSRLREDGRYKRDIHQ